MTRWIWIGEGLLGGAISGTLLLGAFVLTIGWAGIDGGDWFGFLGSLIGGGVIAWAVIRLDRREARRALVAERTAVLTSMQEFIAVFEDPDRQSPYARRTHPILDAARRTQFMIDRATRLTPLELMTLADVHALVEEQRTSEINARWWLNDDVRLPGIAANEMHLTGRGQAIYDALKTSVASLNAHLGLEASHAATP